MSQIYAASPLEPESILRIKCLPFLCLNMGISLEVWEMEKGILTHEEKRVKINKYVDQELEKWEW